MFDNQPPKTVSKENNGSENLIFFRTFCREIVDELIRVALDTSLSSLAKKLHDLGVIAPL